MLPTRRRSCPTVGFFRRKYTIRLGPIYLCFRSAARELGWIENRNVRDRVSLGRRPYRPLGDIATEFVRLKVDVIFAPVTVVAIDREKGNRHDPDRLPPSYPTRPPSGLLRAWRIRAATSPARQINRSISQASDLV